MESRPKGLLFYLYVFPYQAREIAFNFLFNNHPAFGTPSRFSNGKEYREG